MLHLFFVLALQIAPTPAPTQLPYPAYGAPAPGTATQRPVAGVPQQITLNQAIAIAVAKSPVLAAARANRQLTQIPVQLARTAILPNVSGTATLTQSRRFGNAAGTSTTGTTGSVGNSFVSKGLNASLRQLIYDGGRVIAQIHQAKANAVAGADTYERNLQTLAFNVAQAYYNVLQANATTQLDVQVVNQNVVQENLVRAQLQAGTASRVDLATAQLPTAQARVALVRQQGTALAAVAAFAETLGLDPDALVMPQSTAAAVQTSSAVPILSYDQAVTRALALRPDYHSSQEAVLAAQYNLQFQRSGLFPSLNGTASYGTNSTNVAGGAFGPSDSVGLTLSIPVWDQGVTRAQTETAQAQLDLANAELSQTRLTVETDVRQALVGLVSAQAAVAQAQAELAKAQEILRATQAQYRAGVTTLPLLLNAQVGLTQAQTDQVNALFGLRQAEQTYIFSLGESDLIPAGS
ncbi:MAG TPA: TolC family protein [Candidatus Baltobacteraceae bacterium]|jgi:outer membrane protein TolC|nr:TolC family protein [Candidatus Baltobacteraceae bacterium]